MVRRFVSFLVLAGAAFAAPAQDYAREARWRAEVVGNLVVGEAVDIPGADGRKFLGLYAPAPKAAVLLVHGLGVHPDHGVIGSLRVALSDMGYATLSIQMPVLAADAPGEAYEPLLPDAVARIAAGLEWLRARGHRTVVLASHSLGSRFALEAVQAHAFAGWICMGRGGAIPPLALPVLDVYGENDNPAVLKSVGERRATQQVMIAGADHFYNGREEELARVLQRFIESLPAR